MGRSRKITMVFIVFINNKIIDLIIIETNRYVQQKLKLTASVWMDTN